VRIAYLVSAYRSPQQLKRLVDRLSTENTEFYIHIDLKSRREFKQLIGQFSNCSDITVLPSHRVAWGSFGHVLASIKGIASSTLIGKAPDNLVLLTGQDYPIKSNSQIEEFLKQNHQHSFMEHFQLPWHLWEHERGGADRFEYFYLAFAGRKLYRVPGVRRDFPTGFIPYGGSSYWSLNYEAIEYLAKFITDQREYVKFFRNVRIPDELFFQTALMNSPLREQIVNNNLRFTKWQSGSPHPEVLTNESFEDLKGSPALFARKFDTEEDASILDRIDAELL